MRQCTSTELHAEVLIENWVPLFWPKAKLNSEQVAISLSIS